MSDTDKKTFIGGISFFKEGIKKKWNREKIRVQKLKGEKIWNVVKEIKISIVLDKFFNIIYDGETYSSISLFFKAANIIAPNSRKKESQYTNFYFKGTSLAKMSFLENDEELTSDNESDEEENMDENEAELEAKQKGNKKKRKRNKKKRKRNKKVKKK